MRHLLLAGTIVCSAVTTWLAFRGGLLVRELNALARLKATGAEVTAFLADDGLPSWCAHYTRLSLTGRQIDDRTLTELRWFPQLKELELHRTAVRGFGLSVIVPEHFESLAISSSPATDRGISGIGRLCHLRELDLFGTEINGSALRGLARCQQIRTLYLCYNRKLLPQHLYGLKDWPALRYLRLSMAGGRAEADEAFRAVCTLKLLDVVNVCTSPLTDSALESVPEDAKWRQLDLSETAITDKGVQYVSRLRGLERLHLRRTNVRGPGLASLAPLSKLIVLDLTQAAISSESLKSLPSLPALGHLDIAHTAVTDAGVDVVAQRMAERLPVGSHPRTIHVTATQTTSWLKNKRQYIYVSKNAGGKGVWSDSFPDGSE